MGSISQLCPGSVWLESGEIAGIADSSSVIERYLKTAHVATEAEAYFEFDRSKDAQVKRVRLVNEENETSGPDCEQEIIGIRPGEKLHEEMVTGTDALNTIETQKHYIIVPASPFCSIQDNVERYSEDHEGTLVPSGFNYSSGTNSEWLSVDNLREVIFEHLGVNLSEFQLHDPAPSGNGNGKANSEVRGAAHEV